MHVQDSPNMLGIKNLAQSTIGGHGWPRNCLQRQCRVGPSFSRQEQMEARVAVAAADESHALQQLIIQVIGTVEMGTPIFSRKTTMGI